MIDYEVCSEEYLNNIKQVNPNSLSLDEEVFHIIGRPDRVWIVDSYCDILKYKTKDLYDLLEKKGGRCVRKAGSGDGSLTHFFVEPLNDSIAYTSESSQLTNPNPIYKCHLKNLITILTLKCLNLTDIRKTTKLS